MGYSHQVHIQMPNPAVSDEARVRSPFAAKDTIKDSIPSWARWWSNEDRCWIVLDTYVQTLVIALNSEGFIVDVVGPAPDAPSAPLAGWVEGAFSTCMSKAKVESMRKALLKVHHPDHGGSITLVTQINDIANRRMKEVP